MERLVQCKKGLYVLLVGLAAAVIAVLYGIAVGARTHAQEAANLSVYQVASHFVTLPMSTNSTSADTVQHGTHNWNLFLNNNTASAVTNAAVTVNSGFNAALFRWGDTTPLSSFPQTKTVASLAPGQQWEPSTLSSDVTDDFAPGYSSTRSVSPAIIPVGGGNQTVTITLKPVDARFAPDASVSANVVVGSEVPGTVVTATTDPTNLNEGETVNTPDNPAGLHQWQLGMLRLNKEYTFTATLHVPNNTGAPLTYQPSVNLRMEHAALLAGSATGTSVTVPEPTLDGTLTGSGHVTYAVAEADRNWVVKHSEAWDVMYPGTPKPPEAMQVAMIVNPGSGTPAWVVPGRFGLVTVVVPSTADLDASMIGMIKFGVTGTESPPLLTQQIDVTFDGRKDLVMLFSTSKAGIVCGATQVQLTGKFAMTDVHSSAPIRTWCPR